MTIVFESVVVSTARRCASRTSSLARRRAVAELAGDTDFRARIRAGADFVDGSCARKA
jgi:hypothetical protein